MSDEYESCEGWWLGALLLWGAFVCGVAVGVAASCLW